MSAEGAAVESNDVDATRDCIQAGGVCAAVSWLSGVAIIRVCTKYVRYIVPVMY